MNPFGALFTITLFILLVFWPYIALYIVSKINLHIPRQNYQPFDHLDACSNENHQCSCKQRRYAE